MPTSLLNPLQAAHRHSHGRLFLLPSSATSTSTTSSSLSFLSLPLTYAMKSKSKLLKVKQPLLPFSSRSDRSTAMDTSCKVEIITQERFSEDVLRSDLPVLVGFCADWCGPCKLIGPILDTVSKQFDGSMKTLKIDTDASPDLVKEYDVYGLPTLILFKDGKEVPNGRKEGTINAQKLKEFLDELLSTS